MRRSVMIYCLGIGILLCALVEIGFVLKEQENKQLQVTFLAVGQGDSILVRSPTGRHILIDGGPDATILRQIGAHMPWYDRSLDVVIATHPDLDHIGGLIDVFDRYHVGIFVHSSVQNDSSHMNILQHQVRTHDTQEIVAKRGMHIDIGDGAYLEVLSPDRAVPHVDTNAGCVVAKLTYRDTSFMLPCDAPKAIEEYLVYLDAEHLHATVLKAGHHGSKTASSATFVGFVDPQYVVFSRGCDNKYTFPHAEVVRLFERFGVPSFDTCIDGAVTFVSDGKEVRKQ